MASQRVFNHCVRIASAIALLVAVTFSPLRPNTGTGSLRSDFVRSDVARAPARPAFPLRVVPTSVASRPMSVKALRSENEEEEELAGIIRPASDLFAVPPSLSAIPARDFVVFGWHPTAFPASLLSRPVQVVRTCRVSSRVAPLAHGLRFDLDCAAQRPRVSQR